MDRPENIKYHQTLANFFSDKSLYLDEYKHNKPNSRKLIEQPWQQIRAEMWSEISNTLTDLCFIEAKCKAEMAIVLLGDYQISGLLSNDHRTRINPVFPKSVVQFAEFIKRENHIFVRFPEIVVQQALNWPDWSAPAIAANQLLSQYTYKKLVWSNKPQQLDSCLFTVTLKSAGNNITNNYIGLAAETAMAAAVNGSVVRIYDLQTFTEKINFNLPSGLKIINTSFSNNGKWFITITEDRNLNVWDVLKGTKLFEIHLIFGQNCSFSSDSQNILSCMLPGVICVWDITIKNVIAVIQNQNANLDDMSYEDEPMVFALSDDRRYAATGMSHSGIISLWDLSGSRVIKEFKANKDWLYACCFSPDGNRLISVGGDSYLKVWDVPGGNLIVSLPVPPLSANSAHTPGGYGGISSCTFSHDGRFILLGCWDCSVRLWDASELKPLCIFKGHGSPVIKCGFSKDYSGIFSASNDGVYKYWDISRLPEDEILRGHNGMVIGMFVSPDGRFIKTESKDFKQQVWDFSFNPPVISQFDELNPDDIKKVPYYSWRPVKKKLRDGQLLSYIATSPDRKYEATYSVSSQSVHLIDTIARKEIALLDGPETINLKIKGNLKLIGVTVCRFSDDSRLLMTASEDCTLKIWSATSGVLLCVFPTAAVISTATFCQGGKAICAGDAVGNVYALNIEIPST